METKSSAGEPISLLRNRDYLLLWLGQEVSSLGTGISQFAFPLLMLAITHSFIAAGMAGALGQLPYVLFSLPAGALADRWERKRVMIVCTLGLTLCTGSIPLAMIRGHLTVVPDELQGRVGSVYRLILFGSLALGQAGVGYCLERLGVLVTVGVMWCGLIVFGGLVLMHSGMRKAVFPEDLG